MIVTPFLNKDTICLALKVAGEEITSDLNYNLFEKDSNKGSINFGNKSMHMLHDYSISTAFVLLGTDLTLNTAKRK